jgi:hypothetical protein
LHVLYNVHPGPGATLERLELHTHRGKRDLGRLDAFTGSDFVGRLRKSALKHDRLGAKRRSRGRKQVICRAPGLSMEFIVQTFGALRSASLPPIHFFVMVASVSVLRADIALHHFLCAVRHAARRGRIP